MQRDTLTLYPFTDKGNQRLDISLEQLGIEMALVTKML